jgi:hypothetical protein
MATNKRISKTTKYARVPGPAADYTPRKRKVEDHERNICANPRAKVTSVGKYNGRSYVTEHKSVEAAQAEYDKRSKSHRHTNVQITKYGDA